MTTSYPGVYIQEVSSGVRPIQAASTSTAAFLGEAARGPIGVPVRVVNFTEFQATFGGFLEQTFLAHAVFQFFNNGGSQCYVVRVASNPQAASATIVDRADAPHESVKITASSPGAWGNDLEIEVADSAKDPDNCFDLVVYLTSSGQRQQAERLSDLSMDPDSASYVTAVTRTASRYITVDVIADPQASVAGYAQGAPVTAASAGSLLDAAHRTLQVSLNADGFQTIDLSGADLSTLEKIRAALQSALTQKSPLRLPADANPYPDATVTLDGTGDAQALRVTSGKPGPRSIVEIRPAPASGQDAARLLRLYPPAKTTGGAAVLRPSSAGNPYLIGDTSSGECGRPRPGTRRAWRAASGSPVT